MRLLGIEPRPVVYKTTALPLCYRRSAIVPDLSKSTDLVIKRNPPPADATGRNWRDYALTGFNLKGLTSA